MMSKNEAQKRLFEISVEPAVFVLVEENHSFGDLLVRVIVGEGKLDH